MRPCVYYEDLIQGAAKIFAGKMIGSPGGEQLSDIRSVSWITGTGQELDNRDRTGREHT